jgi:hypothetical protein
MTDLVGASILDWRTSVERERQESIVLARKYHEGEQGVPLTDRLKEFLGEKVLFRMNICRQVVTAVAERLIVTGFDSADPKIITWAWDTWQTLELDAKQEEVHEGGLRDGEYFLLLGWDNEENIPLAVPHQRFTDTNVDGDGEGCVMVYEQDDPNQKALYGIKQWIEYGSSFAETFVRRTLYYPDRIEKYRKQPFMSDWEMYQPLGDEEWPLPWVDKSGKPLGIALIPYNNKGLRCEAWEAIPLQNGVNKTLLDLLASSDMTAFRIFYSLGFVPTSDGRVPKDDGSNILRIEPGRVVGTTKSARDTEFGSIEPANLESLMDLTHQMVLWAAMVTNTPVSRFISTKLIASDATLKEQEGPLISRARSRQTSFGNSWVKAFNLLRRLQNTFGEGDALDEDAKINIIWGEAAARGEAEKLELLEVKQRALGVPREQLWVEAGYDQVKIAAMREMLAKESRDGRGRQGRDDLGTGNGGTDEGEGGTQDGER